MNYNNIIVLIIMCCSLNLIAMDSPYCPVQSNYIVPHQPYMPSNQQNSQGLYPSDEEGSNLDPYFHERIQPLFSGYKLQSAISEELTRGLYERKMTLFKNFLSNEGINDWDYFCAFFNQMCNKNEKDWKFQYSQISHYLPFPAGFQDMVVQELERCGISPSRIRLQYDTSLTKLFFKIISPAFSINQQGQRIAHPGVIAFSLPVFKQKYHPSNGSEFLRAITLYAIAQLKSEATIYTNALINVFYKHSKRVDTQSLCVLQKELHNIAILEAAIKDCTMAKYFKQFSWSSDKIFSDEDIDLLKMIVEDVWNITNNSVNDNLFLNYVFN